MRNLLKRRSLISYSVFHFNDILTTVPWRSIDVDTVITIEAEYLKSLAAIFIRLGWILEFEKSTFVRMQGRYKELGQEVRYNIVGISTASYMDLFFDQQLLHSFLFSSLKSLHHWHRPLQINNPLERERERVREKSQWGRERLKAYISPLSSFKNI